MPVLPLHATPRYQHVDLAEAERLMLAELNRLRLRHELPLLQLDPAVSRVAERHARDMVRRNYFAHHSPEGLGPQERLAKADLPWPVGENLGVMRSFGLGTNEIVLGLMQALLDSPVHRANLLDPRATHVGLGFAQDKDDQTAFMDLDLAGRPGAGTVLVVQEFVRKPLKQWSPAAANRTNSPRERMLLTGDPAEGYAFVAVEVIDLASRTLVRYQHLPVVGGSFRAELRLEQPGEYEVRVLGLHADALLQTPEPLGVFLWTIEDGAAPAAAGSPF